MANYNPQKIEKKWQEHWRKEKLFFADDKSAKEKKFILVEFPYPSGDGLHMGHMRSYVAGDVYSRYWRMKGKEVMYPIGWDAFGLPAENYAIQHGVHPTVSTKKNIDSMRAQMDALGLSFDWSREVNTTDPEYYKWTQWLFLQFFKAGLAYEATGLINWCPKDKTGLANEEVIDGKCERCHTPVEKKEIRQWYLKITAYAEKLLEGLKTLNWPGPVRVQQENWIGRSEGAEIGFRVKGLGDSIKVFTTRVDTLFGATYLVLAPEHPLLVNNELGITNYTEVKEYIEQAKKKTELQRSALEKEKTGVELRGVKAINPANQKEIPVWIADYVLPDYGTGAIMAVPKHDERDAQFAEKYALPFSDAPLVDKEEIIKQVGGQKKVQYKLRDWVFSRQRYWGEPIPLVHCEKCGVVAVPDKDLPVTLPELKKYEPTGTGESPLAAIEDWVNTQCPQCGGAGKRETNTMPQWAGSSWYWLRYSDPQNNQEFANKEKLARWQPVDIYFGGMEHTTLHLLYSRFWNQFLYDQGLVTAPEPYLYRKPHGIVLAADGEKMSKSRGNVVNPNALIKEYGADTVRLYEMFLGPHEAMVTWNERGIVGVSRFLERVWQWTSEQVEKYRPEADQPEADNPQVETALQKLIKKIGEDIENFSFNTAVAAFMSFYNEVKDTSLSPAQLKKFAAVLYPFAPHLAEEINELVGNKKSLQLLPWPEFDSAKLKSQKVNLVVQVSGKTRAVVEVEAGLTEAAAKALALAEANIQKHLAGAEIKQVIYRPDRLINFVL